MWIDLIEFLSGRSLFVEMVSWTGLFLLLVVAATLCAIAVLRLQYRFSSRRERWVRENWTPVFNALRTGEKMQWPVTRSAYRRPLLEFWVEQRELAVPGYGAALDALALEVGLDATVCKILKLHPMVLLHRKIWLQAIAVTAARWIDTAETRASLFTVLESENSFLAAKACVTLVRLNAEGSSRELVRTLFRFPKHAPYIAVQLSEAGASSILHTLAPFIDFLPAYTEMNFISLLERTDDRSLLPILLARLERTEEVEERAAILRALGRIGGDANRSRVEAYLDSPVAALRIQAIKALGKLGRFQDRDLLVPFLSDADWWVRYRAARSYLKLCGEYRDDLEIFIESLEDRYARDIMRHALAEIDWSMR